MKLPAQGEFSSVRQRAEEENIRLQGPLIQLITAIAGVCRQATAAEGRMPKAQEGAEEWKEITFVNMTNSKH